MGKDVGTTGEIVVLILSLYTVPSEDCAFTPSENVSSSKDGRFTRGRMSGVLSLCSKLAILSRAPRVLVVVGGVKIVGS